MKFLVCVILLTSAVCAEEEKSKHSKRGLSSIGDYSSIIDHDSGISYNSLSLGGGYEDSFQDHGHVNHITLHKKVTVPIPHPVPVPVEKHIPVPVQVPVPVKVDKPYPVHVPLPYPVHIDKPYPVKIEKTIPVPVKIPVKVPVPFKVPLPYAKPYPVPIHKHVPVHIPEYNIVKKPVPVFVKGHEEIEGLALEGHGSLGGGFHGLSLGEEHFEY